MQKNIYKEKEQTNEKYVLNNTRAILGTINGSILPNYLWPLILLSLLSLILGSNYNTFINEHYAIMEMTLNIITSLLTILLAIIIAKPKRLMKAFSKFDKAQVKTLFVIFGIMTAFTLTYNFILLLSGLDVGNGNENQQIVTLLIKQAPILAFVAFVLVGPISEELTYRYFLFGGVKKYSRVGAYIACGIIFMLAHGMAGFLSKDANIWYELLLLPPYFFSGVALAYAYEKHDNLLIPLSIHMLNNLLSFVITFI